MLSSHLFVCRLDLKANFSHLQAMAISNKFVLLVQQRKPSNWQKLSVWQFPLTTVGHDTMLSVLSFTNTWLGSNRRVASLRCRIRVLNTIRINLSILLIDVILFERKISDKTKALCLVFFHISYKFVMQELFLTMKLGLEMKTIGKLLRTIEAMKVPIVIGLIRSARGAVLKSNSICD